MLAGSSSSAHNSAIRLSAAGWALRSPCRSRTFSRRDDLEEQAVSLRDQLLSPLEEVGRLLEGEHAGRPATGAQVPGMGSGSCAWS